MENDNSPSGRPAGTSDSLASVQAQTAQQQHGSGRSGASSGGSQRSIASPTLDPAQANAMTSSVISTLDLGEERAFPTNGETVSASSQGKARQPGASTLANGSGTHDDAPSTSVSSSTAPSQVTPLAPRDVLASTQASTSSLGPSFSTRSIPSLGSSSQMTEKGGMADADLSGYSQTGADDSALNALMEAHGREQSPHRPSKRDASFGLDPDVDTVHSVHGQPFRPHLLSSPLRRPHKHHEHGHSHHEHHHHAGSHQSPLQAGSVYDMPEEHSFSHTTAATGAPDTTETGLDHTHTVPTVSATGMPRILPRRRSRSVSPEDEKRGRRQGTSSGASSRAPSEAPAPRETQPQYAPSGSLTLALFSPGIGWRRRSYLLLASVAINIGLPFINGVMLGFGEIFARSIVAPWIGLAPAAININAPAARQQAQPSAAARGTVPTGNGVGLRYAGAARPESSSGQQRGR